MRIQSIITIVGLSLFIAVGGNMQLSQGTESHDPSDAMVTPAAPSFTPADLPAPPRVSHALTADGLRR